MTEVGLRTPAEFDTLRSTNLSQLVFESIREAIVSQALPPGSRVTESGLAGQLKVSKTPVREALITLRQIGLIEVDGRRGDRVIRPSRRTLQNAYDAREALEVFTARRAAERARPEESALITEAAQRSLRGAHAGDEAMFRAGDDVFHRSITEACENSQLTRMIDNLFLLIITLRQRDSPDKEVSIRCGEDHVAIAAAITAHDPDAAEERIRAHIRYIAQNVISTMESRQDPDGGTQ